MNETLENMLKNATPEHAAFLMKGLQSIVETGSHKRPPKFSAASTSVLSGARVQPTPLLTVVIKDSNRIVRIVPESFDSETMSKDLTRAKAKK